VAAGAAAQVQHFAVANAGDGEDLVDLQERIGETLHREHVRVKIAPEIFTLEPGHFSSLAGGRRALACDWDRPT
jgi:hypothetical protein